MYRWVDHTSEVELAIEASCEREVFEQATVAVAELLGISGATPSFNRPVSVSAPDRPALLAAWLEELVYLAESEGFVGCAVTQLSIGEDSVSGIVRGLLADPPPLVKAVTYHRLAFDRRGDGYVASVVLDV
jgi:SHS2 domain-containing protein